MERWACKLLSPRWMNGVLWTSVGFTRMALELLAMLLNKSSQELITWPTRRPLNLAHLKLSS